MNKLNYYQAPLTLAMNGSCLRRGPCTARPSRLRLTSYACTTLLECREATSDDRVTHHSAPLATTADEGNTMRIAAIPIATADLGSDGGVIDGCARVHWRGRAMFPAAGDGSGTFVFRRHLRGSLHVYCAKVRFSGACPLVGFYLVASSSGG